MKKEKIMKVLEELVALSKENDAKLESEEARILNSIVTTTMMVVSKEINKLYEQEKTVKVTQETSSE